MNLIKLKLYIYKQWTYNYFLIFIYDIINFIDKIKIILKQWRSRLSNNNNNNFSMKNMVII